MVTAAASVRPSLRLVLGLTAVATAVAVWWPEGTVSAPSSVVRSVSAAGTSVTPERVSSAVDEPAAAVNLPERLPRPSLEPASFDPFVGVRPAPPAPPPSPVAVAPLVATPVMAPVAPTLNYRYLGGMTDPSGERRVYLARGDSAVAVSVGARLDEGYVVEAIDSEAVRLHYPPLDAHVRIPIPAHQEENNR